MGQCPNEALQFPTTFDRLSETFGAVGGDGTQAGWFTSDGDFVQVGPGSTSSEWEQSTAPYSIGFDKHDNFYYRVEHGSSTLDHFNEYFRVPAGQTGNGEFVGRIDSSDDTRFGMLPDGTLGLNPPDSCVPPIVSISTRRDKIERSDTCDTQSAKVELTPINNQGIDSLAVSPDKTDVVFKTGSNTLYIMSVQGGDPRPIATAGPLRSPAYYEVWSWI